jgi:hypothetical protein
MEVVDTAGDPDLYKVLTGIGQALVLKHVEIKQ